jgi:hypothetical protein
MEREAAMNEQEKVWWIRAIAGAVLLVLCTFAVERIEQMWQRWNAPTFEFETVATELSGS